MSKVWKVRALLLRTQMRLQPVVVVHHFRSKKNTQDLKSPLKMRAFLWALKAQVTNAVIVKSSLK